MEDLPPVTPVLPAANTSPSYYVANGDSRIGPLTRQTLLDRVRSGDLSPETMIWQEGATDWASLKVLLPEYAVPALSTPTSLPGFPASFGERTLAFILDWFILIIPFSVVCLVGSLICAALTAIVAPIGLLATLILYGALGFVVPAYPIFTISSSKQATPGMALMKIRAVTETGGDVDLKASFIRALVGSILSPIFLIGFIWPLFDAKRRTLHDQLAGTLVIKA